MYKQNGKGKLRFSQMYKPSGPVAGPVAGRVRKALFYGDI